MSNPSFTPSTSPVGPPPANTNFQPMSEGKGSFGSTNKPSSSWRKFIRKPTKQSVIVSVIPFAFLERTTTSWAGFVSAKIFHTIPEGYRISVSDPDAAAIVTRSFVVEVSPSGEEYIATSRISNTYEFGATPDQAISTYLEFLVDELIWLQKNEAQLSPSIQEDLRLLQRYLRIV